MTTAGRSPRAWERRRWVWRRPARLLEHGWDVSVLTTEDMMALYDRQPPEGIEDGSPDTLFVSAQRSVL